MQKLNRLSDRTVKTTFPGKHHDGGGLYLVVTESVSGISRSWSFRYSIGNGKTRYLGIGAYPLVGLAEARRKAGDARALISDGQDPISHKRAARAALSQQQPKVITFSECAAKYIESHEASWRGVRNHAQWVRTLTIYAYPVLGNLPVSEITREHVLRVLRPLWLTKCETAGALRGRIERILSWAGAMGYREGANPAVWKGGLDHVLPSKAKVRPVVHHPALAFRDVPAFMGELRAREAIAARCLEFLILSAVRSAEAIGAKWDEIDLEARTWVLPRERTKTFKEFRVPLSSGAVALLKALPRDGEHVFIRRGAMLSTMAMRALLMRMGRRDFTIHGFRATFSTWARETTNFAREVVEAALGHVVGDVVERSYARGDALERRRALMEAWGAYIDREPVSATVVPLRNVS
jgi:integrase